MIKKDDKKNIFYQRILDTFINSNLDIEEYHGDIFLHCCVGVDYDLDILPHFLKYYKDMGVNKFSIVLNTKENENNIITAQNILRKFNIEEKVIWYGIFDVKEKEKYRENIKNKDIEDNDWIVSVDVDEFNVYPIKLRKFISICEKFNFNCVKGNMVDRLSENNKIINIDEYTNLEESFPCRTDLSRINDCRPLYSKIVLNKKIINTSRGNHFVENQEEALFFPFVLDVDHFKWRGKLIEKLEDRVINYQKLGYSWWETSDFFIKYFKKGIE